MERTFVKRQDMVKGRKSSEKKELKKVVKDLKKQGLAGKVVDFYSDPNKIKFKQCFGWYNH